MKYESLYKYSTDNRCCYGKSRLSFRGPQKSLTDNYVSFIGGTQTFGKGATFPFPEIVENRIGKMCLNLGVANASIDAFINDQSVLDIACNGDLTVLEIMGPQNLSNRFYRVHPRRNDRFLQESTVLKALYPEVDFTEFDFTGHLLKTLSELSKERFEIVISELQEVWLERMKLLLATVDRKTILLWIHDATIQQYVSTDMIDEIRDSVHEIIEFEAATYGMHWLGGEHHKVIGEKLALSIQAI